MQKKKVIKIKRERIELKFAQKEKICSNRLCRVGKTCLILPEQTQGTNELHLASVGWMGLSGHRAIDHHGRWNRASMPPVMR